MLQLLQSVIDWSNWSGAAGDYFTFLGGGAIKRNLGGSGLIWGGGNESA